MHWIGTIKTIGYFHAGARTQEEKSY